MTNVRTGYKVVDADGQSLHGDPRVVYAVGSRYALPVGMAPKICDRGFHYCPVALECLRFVAFRRDYRLLEVTVPDDAEIVCDNGGLKWAASAIDVVADATADIPRLLTGVTRPTTSDPGQQAVHFYEAGLRHRLDGPAIMLRGEVKFWYRQGEEWSSPSALVGDAACCGLHRVSPKKIWAHYGPGWGRWIFDDGDATLWAAAVAVLDRDDDVVDAASTVSKA
jgi:hypothetical protein